MYDLKAIMTRAHEIRKFYRWTMAMALRSAWQEAKYQAEAFKVDSNFLRQMKDHWDRSDFEVELQYQQSQRKLNEVA